MCATSTRRSALAADLPVMHVNWYEPKAYCGCQARLPTEAEWNYRDGSRS